MANLGHTDTMLQYFNPVEMPVNIWQILPYPLYTVYSEYRYSNDFQPSAILSTNPKFLRKKCFTYYSIHSSHFLFI